MSSMFGYVCTRVNIIFKGLCYEIMYTIKDKIRRDKKVIFYD